MAGTKIPRPASPLNGRTIHPVFRPGRPATDARDFLASPRSCWNARSMVDLVVIGGGAAGFFGAIAAAEASPGARIVLLEATAYTLSKVRISGGGRCNATHACFEPRELSRKYPRGGRELVGPFTRFGPRETIAWFAARGVELKTEEDGRMFPVTDDSATITQCLLGAAQAAHVDLRLRCPAREIVPLPGGGFEVRTGAGPIETRRVLIATGGGRGAGGYALAEGLGHTIAPPVPSLFTFHIDDARLKGLEGLSVPEAATSVAEERKLQETGPVLVTHWGLSGPGILKLSAWGARALADRDYRFTLTVNWLGARRPADAQTALAAERERHPKRQLATANPFGLPGRLWERLVGASGLTPESLWAGASNSRLQTLAENLCAARFQVSGKSLNKEEFVTCGGVSLKEVDFATLESRNVPGLHFAGEVLDIDGVTGGFNFQAAWTTAWHAGRSAVGHPPGA
jgi:predicted Rossmann fold flavoprotein